MQNNKVFSFLLSKEEKQFSSFLGTINVLYVALLDFHYDTIFYYNNAIITKLCNVLATYDCQIEFLLRNVRKIWNRVGSNFIRGI